MSASFVLLTDGFSSLSAWFFFKLMNVSGAEAIVAAASPWIGQGQSTGTDRKGVSDKSL